jgi:hypothetical protein
MTLVVHLQGATLTDKDGGLCGMVYDVILQESSDKAIARATCVLNKAGFRVEQSFALHHTYHYVVLLVYGQDQCPPSTVLVHGYDDACSRFVLPDRAGANIQHYKDIYEVLVSLEA